MAESTAKYLYVVLSQTVSVVGRTLRTVMRNEYAHISVSFSKELSPMYSFSRLDVENPFVGGPSLEELGDYFLGKKDSQLKMKVFKIPITGQEYIDAECFIFDVFNDKEGYRYNIMEPLNAFKTKPIHCYKTYVCSSFVAEILAHINLPKIESKKSFISPQTIGTAIDEYLIYQGTILEYPFFHKDTIRKIKRRKLKVVNVPAETTAFYSFVLFRHLKFKYTYFRLSQNKE